MLHESNLAVLAEHHSLTEIFMRDTVAFPRRRRTGAARYRQGDGARTFLSAAAFKSSPGLVSRWTVAAIGACCGQECPRPGGDVRMGPWWWHLGIALLVAYASNSPPAQAN